MADRTDVRTQAVRLLRSRVDDAQVSVLRGIMGLMSALEVIVDEGRPASAWRFFQLGHDLLALLDELSDVPAEWRLTDLRTGSAIASVSPPEEHPEHADVLHLAYTTLVVVRDGGGFSDAWSPDAVRMARRLVDHGQQSDDEPSWVPPRLRLVHADVPAEPGVRLTPDLSDQLAALQPFERTMPGSVRGTLVGLNVSRGNRASLRLPNKSVVRVAFETSLRGDLKDALYQDVELRGLVKQDGDGRVFHVRADHAEVLLRPVTRWADLFGIDPNFTGGQSTDDYLEVARGEA